MINSFETKDVFISYKAEEINEASWVKTTLENNGISCWMAPMCISGGSNYAKEIPQAIRECKVFVLVLSNKAQESRWVPKEVDKAINYNKVIMPFMIENCRLTDEFDFYLANVQIYSAYENREENIKRMMNDINAVIRKNNTNQYGNPQTTHYTKPFDNPFTNQKYKSPILNKKININWGSFQTIKIKKKNIVLALAIFPYTGCLGVHDFYLRKWKLGILKLCTINFFGFGWFVDIIRLLLGRYETKDGEYLK